MLKEKRTGTDVEFFNNHNVEEIHHSVFREELQRFYEFMYHNNLIDLNYMENYKK